MQNKINNLQIELEELHQQKPVCPRVPHIVRTDDTPENLAYELTYGWPSAGIISSEGALVLASRAMQKETMMAMLAMYNVFWEGGVWRIGRKTSDSYTVSGARVAIGLQVQPAVMEKFLEGSENIARGIGFIARCLLSYPDSTQGSRPYQDPPDKMLNVDIFNQMVTKFLKIKPAMEDGRLKPATVLLSAEAKECWINFHNKIEGDLARGKKYESLKDVASKIADNASRLAALFAACRGFPITEIDRESMESGCAVAEWHLYEALRYLGTATAEENEIAKHAKAVERRLIALAQKSEVIFVEKRIFMQSASKPISKNEQLIPAIDFLAQRNRARFSSDGSIIEINPELFTLAEYIDAHPQGELG